MTIDETRSMLRGHSEMLGFIISDMEGQIDQRLLACRLPAILAKNLVDAYLRDLDDEGPQKP